MASLLLQAEADQDGLQEGGGGEAALPEAAFLASFVLEPWAGPLARLGALPSHWADLLYWAGLL